MTNEWKELLQIMRLPNRYQELVQIGLSTPKLLNETNRQGLTIWKNMGQIGSAIVNLCTDDFAFCEVTQDIAVFSKYTKSYATFFITEFEHTYPEFLRLSKQINRFDGADELNYEYIPVNMIAIIYLTVGYSGVYQFLEPVHRAIAHKLSKTAGDTDLKTALQEWAQARHLTPVYTVVAETGPEHAKVFRVRVDVGRKSAEGEGSAKKQAERLAAGEYLRTYGGSSVAAKLAAPKNSRYQLPAGSVTLSKSAKALADSWRLPPALAQECLRTPSYCNGRFAKKTCKSCRNYAALGASLFRALAVDQGFPNESALYGTVDLAKLVRLIVSQESLEEVSKLLHLKEIAETAATDIPALNKILAEIPKALIGGAFLTEKAAGREIFRVSQLLPAQVASKFGALCRENISDTKLDEYISQLTAISEVAGWKLEYTSYRMGKETFPRYQNKVCISGQGWKLTCTPSKVSGTKSEARGEAAKAMVLKLIGLFGTSPLPPAARSLCDTFGRIGPKPIRMIIYDAIFKRAGFDPLTEMSDIKPIVEHLSMLLHKGRTVSDEQLKYMIQRIGSLGDLNVVDRFISAFPDRMNDELRELVLQKAETLY